MYEVNWSDILAEEKQKPYFKKILEFLANEALVGKTIFPTKENVFNAFKYTRLDNLKVVILGQDPYHNYNQAHGLAFSVQQGVDIPPSLRNIYKELARSILGFEIPSHGCLVDWAKQGVFLLNTTLTVEAHKANSHKDIGWETFTDTVIQKISDNKTNVVFMLWGSHARKKKNLIDTAKHLVLESSHPSPLSVYRGFDGCDHFVKANQYLTSKDLDIIDWRL
ncbi:uracil-DNA glycosylase [Francisella philomiragia]|uniref:uracil-DNA glycosylase n=1 Tax=Francisella philomiragia TaxID=28110 RepID=UPI0009B85559|nr:uracil-DNA glycosylase [Francisella philomiragia]MBK2255390.1 uracil-DNA glycosylase [Francisella philomiragia]MBK2273703.1 uracil-DNA glycosylase [Francisella philomiragia]MBK2277584.1 uracil-DNA glycosylase [Francisella philomiragia]MBK2281560.1 uracil-DNA glycosylase [Francisella philomiragia]MBK2283395.1 uracil-DNA glycosylase [Francisella philomiragia]